MIIPVIRSDVSEITLLVLMIKCRQENGRERETHHSEADRKYNEGRRKLPPLDVQEFSDASAS